MKTSENRTKIYNRPQLSLEILHRKIADSEMNEADQAAVQAYMEHFASKNSSMLRLDKVVTQLIVMCRLKTKTGRVKPLMKLDKKDVEVLLVGVNTHTKWSETTKSDYRRIIKSFYKVMQDDDPRLSSTNETERREAERLYKHVRDDVKRGDPRKKIDYSSIITDEDRQQLIDAGDNAMEKALICFLHESGVRVGELLGLRIRDIKFQRDMAKAYVNGKTGERNVPVAQSVPYLQRWLEEHPDKNNPNALVWISKHNRYNGQPLRYIGVTRVLQRAKRRAGLTKRCNPHWFRHSRATIIASKYPQSIIEKMMGWIPGSRESRTYIHLGEGQVDEEFMKQNGLEVDEKAKTTSQRCVCGAVNGVFARYCARCGKALSVGAILEDEAQIREETDKTVQYLMEIVKNPALLSQLEAFKRQKGRE